MVTVDEQFHIPVGANRDPDDRAYLAQFPSNYDDPGPRFYDVEGMAWINGSPNGINQDIRWYKQAIVGPDPSLSLYVFSYIADSPIRNHFHDVDQIAIVTRGEAFMGNKRVGVGEGVLMPAGNAYGFTPGAGGVEMFELRRRAPFRWGIPKNETGIAGWERKHEYKAIYFDVDTAVPRAIGSVRAGGTTIEVDGTVRCALEPYANDAMSVYAVTLAPDARVPAHAEDVERTIHVRAGTMRVNGSDSMRHGSGVRWPADAPIEIEAGPAGVTYLVHRAAPTWSKSAEGTAWADPSGVLLGF